MVEWKKLEEIAKYRRGSFPQPYGKEEWYNGEGAMPFVQVADVEENAMCLKETTKQYISTLAMPMSVYVPQGSIVVTLQGSIGKVAITQYESYVDRTLGIFTGFKIPINKKYFVYQLQKIFSIKKEKARRGIKKTITKEEFSKFEIPIPSKSEQERIVSILDTFTSSISNLKEQIKERRKQYEYYRDQLLDLEGKDGVEMKTLPQISKNLDRKRKAITSTKRVAGLYPYYGASGIVDYVESYIFDGNYLLISEDGANLIARTTPIAFSIKGKNWVNNHAHVLEFDNLITQKYVEIYLNHIDLSFWINGAAQPKLNQENINKIEYPLPSKQEQLRIVTILDQFEASIANLEAQLKEREKQYEYYRNQLLTFE